jgi:hypothetical protein
MVLRLVSRGRGTLEFEVLTLPNVTPVSTSE